MRNPPTICTGLLQIISRQELFLARLEIDAEGCWLWTGAISQEGYGRYRYNGKNDGVHRIAYELFSGPYDKSFDLDHLCRVRLCANPEHLEPVTRRINLLRGNTIPAKNAKKEFCLRGHKFTPENTNWQIVNGNRSRSCITCRRNYHLEHREQILARSKLDYQKNKAKWKYRYLLKKELLNVPTETAQA